MLGKLFHKNCSKIEGMAWKCFREAVNPRNLFNEMLLEAILQNLNASNVTLYGAFNLLGD